MWMPKPMDQVKRKEEEWEKYFHEHAHKTRNYINVYTCASAQLDIRIHAQKQTFAALIIIIHFF